MGYLQALETAIPQFDVRKLETNEEVMVGDDLQIWGNSSEWRWLANWSPDGNSLAFVNTAWDYASGSYNGGYLYVFSLLGDDGPQFVTNMQWIESGVGIQPPTWSPDSQWLAFTGSDDAESDIGIYVLDAEGLGTLRISVPTIRAHSPAWGGG